MTFDQQYHVDNLFKLVVNARPTEVISKAMGKSCHYLKERNLNDMTSIFCFSFSTARSQLNIEDTPINFHRWCIDDMNNTRRYFMLPCPFRLLSFFYQFAMILRASRSI